MGTQMGGGEVVVVGGHTAWSRGWPSSVGAVAVQAHSHSRDGAQAPTGVVRRRGHAARCATLPRWQPVAVRYGHRSGSVAGCHHVVLQHLGVRTRGDWCWPGATGCGVRGCAECSQQVTGLDVSTRFQLRCCCMTLLQRSHAGGVVRTQGWRTRAVCAPLGLWRRCRTQCRQFLWVSVRCTTAASFQCCELCGGASTILSTGPF